ncbi:MAG: rhodanese-like domain-containing protein [Chryseolinea sp.]
MINTLKNLFGMPPVDYTELVRAGAIIVDVRSKGEYAGAHIKGAINIPLDRLTENLHMIADKQKTIITCCASGMRSSSAAKLLLSKGYISVYNGGGWSSLNSKL